METIEERASEYAHTEWISEFTDIAKESYTKGATEQKAIDDAKLLKLKSAWEKEAQISHDAEMHYKQGYHDAIEKACNIFCYVGCLHKTNSYNCLNNKCDTWKIFKRMMEE